MKKTFQYDHKDRKEVIKIADEIDWIYVQYFINDEIINSAYLMKSENEKLMETLKPFLRENDVSIFLIHKINEEVETNEVNKKLMFTGIIFYITVVLSTLVFVFFGYQLGKMLDIKHSSFPIFSSLGIIIGLSVGVVLAYQMYCYLLKPHL